MNGVKRDAISGDIGEMIVQRMAVNTVDKVCNESLIKFLLDHGADVNCVDKHGRSPLHCAAEVENPSIARMILTNGARVDKADILGYTPLQIAVMRGTTSIVELLIDNGADIYYENFNGATSLSLATNREDKETWYDVMKLLLEKKAKCNKISFYATDALSLAIHNCDLRTSKLLLDHGAHLKEDNLKDPGLLFYVMQEDRVDVLDYVLSRGADVSCTIGFSNEDKDHTPLFWAVRNRYSTKIRNVLIKNIAKLVFLNIWVNEKDLEAIKQDYKMKCYYKNCIEELEKMKIRNIYEDISLFNILIKKGMASGYARNENLIEALDSAENQLSHDFPIYYSSLREVFFEEIKKQKLIKGAAIVLNEFFNFYNPFHLANMKILSYLKHEDILRINETE